MFTEDLDLFFADFGVPVSAGGLSGVGILDMPTQVISDGMVLSTEYSLTVKASQFGGLGYNDEVVVNGTLYQVRHDPMLLDDGAMVRLSLTRLTSYDGVFAADVFVSGVFV
jgi:hypothetical protein